MFRIEGHVDRLRGRGGTLRIDDLRLYRPAEIHDGDSRIRVIHDNGRRDVRVVRYARATPQLGDIIELGKIDGFGRSDRGDHPVGFARQGDGIDSDNVTGEIARRIGQGDPADAVTAVQVIVMAAGRDNGGGAQQRA